MADNAMQATGAGDNPEEWDRIDMFVPYCVLIAVNIDILGPISIYLTSSYYQKRKEHIYSARRPEFVHTLNIASILFIMVVLPIHILIFEILWVNNGGWTEWYNLFVVYTSEIHGPPLVCRYSYCV